MPHLQSEILTPRLIRSARTCPATSHLGKYLEQAIEHQTVVALGPTAKRGAM
jgi:hypothetical protein